MKPTVGRIVHYHATSALTEEPITCAAIITRADYAGGHDALEREDSYEVDLHVFATDGSGGSGAQGVRYTPARGAAAPINTWSWPPRD